MRDTNATWRRVGSAAFLWFLVALGTFTTPVHSQQRTVTLTGFVFDSATGSPIVQVLLTLDGVDLPASTDARGAFVVRGVETGAHTLVMYKTGFGSKTFEFVIGANHPEAIDIGVIGLGKALLHDIVVVGTVTDLSSGAPVGGTPIILNGTVAALTDTNGEFAFRSQIPVGVNRLEIQRVGYEPLSQELHVNPETTELTLNIRLEPAVTPLADIIVEAEAPPESRRLRGFYRRRGSEIGVFLTPEQIAKIPGQQVTDVLRRVPGLQVIRTGMALMIRAPRCLRYPPRILVDYLELSEADIDFALNREDIAAVEVYTSGARIPTEFNRPAPGKCGVVLIWTK
jgi:hypothetical protein